MAERPEILALIPARGGSRGVPRKNILLINGLPLIAYSIHQALTSRYVTRTVVTTDDDEIADVAREWGAETPFMRPAEIAGDDSLDIEAFRHALIWLKENEQYEPDLVVHLRPTEPVRRVPVIDEAIELMLATPDADSLRSISSADYTPYKMWHLDDQYLFPVVTLADVPEAHSVGRQMLPPAYVQNGYVDLIRPRAILDQQSMVGRRILGYLTNGPVCDLDNPSDIARVEQGLRELSQEDQVSRPFVK